MDVLTFLVLVPLTVALWIKHSRLKERYERDNHRVHDLRNELEAMRRAFHGRIAQLEQQVAVLKPGAAAAAEPPAAEPKPAAPDAAPARAPVQAEPPPLAAEPEVESSAPEPEGTEEPARQPPPPELPPPYEPPPPSTPPWGQIDWEQWIGVRGAALLGGIVLALAAALFLQYSIEHGLIPPIVRVAIGLLTGIGCIAGSEFLRKRRYATTANALAGAGAVILYASIWAAQALYSLIGPGLSYPLMVLTTVACGLLAWRHSAKVIATLGLAGGFATPLLLSTGSDNPIGLFAYVLLLDAGLVALARMRRWPILMTLGLAGTVFYQLAWILGRMGPDRYALGLVILGAFSAFFVVAGRWGLTPADSDDERRSWLRTQAAGVLIPFAFGLYFAVHADLGPHLYPVAILMAILCVAAGWLGREEGFELLPLGAAGGALAVVTVWMLSGNLTPALSWEAVGICVGLALIFHVFFELALRGLTEETADKVRGAAKTALILSFGFLLLTATLPALQQSLTVWPWVCAWAVLGAVVVRQSAAPGLAYWRVGAAAGVPLGFAVFLVAHRASPGFPDPALFVALAALACVAFQALAVRGAEKLRHAGDVAAAVSAVALLLAHGLIAASPSMASWLYLSSALVFALFALLAATRMPSGKLYLGAMALASLIHLVWAQTSADVYAQPATIPAAIGILLLSVVIFTFWPFLAGPQLLSRPAAIYAAALAGPAWFFSLGHLYERWLGSETIGVVPVALGALSLLAVQQARKLGPERLRPLVWFAAVALSFLALAIPLQLDKEWITIGWAVQAVAILALWKRLDHPGLKYFALLLLAAVSARLLLNPEVVDYHGRSGWPILNWLAYTYLVPAAALLGAAYLLRDLETPRLRDGESLLYAHGQPAGAILCSVSAIFVVFYWINLTIFDFYSAGSSIQVSFDRMAARDLTLSLAWAVYALVLLGIGFKRDAGALRWLSLAFLVLTIGKVFLHDLGELEDLYRVASLVGLALSLILVSLAYQRFVFRKSSS
jgi:uncharacterized membrane protein